MSELLTNWGYILSDAGALTDLLTTQEFDHFTGGKYSGDERIASDIAAASLAIRNYCGWHLYPSAPCLLKTTFFDRRVIYVESGILIQLPARYVSQATSIKINDEAVDRYVLESNGLLRLFGAPHRYAPYTPIEIEYTAGLPAELMGAVKELVAHRVTHALASSGGVQSETAGGVSITYSANWINSARATALADDNKEVLQPYRLEGVF